MRKTFLVMSRLIDLFVDILPIDELGFKHVKLQSEGLSLIHISEPTRPY